MFSINNKKNSCRTKYINTGVKTGFGPTSLVFSKEQVYSNSPIKIVPNLACIINSTKEKLTYDIYDSARNKAIPIPPIPIPFCEGTPFIAQINTNNTSIGSSSSTQFMLPLVSSGTYNFIIDWGDGSSNKIYGYQNVTHMYSLAGIYTITIIGTFIGWSFNNTGDRLKLLDIIQWGECFRLGTTEGSYFFGASNMNISAVDTLNLEGTTSLYSCFRDCSIMNSPNLIGWDTSNVTSMNSMFVRTTNFNQNIGGWNVSKVTNMSATFYEATSFNNGGSNSIQNWSAPLCTNFNNMFRDTTSFNQPLTNLVDTSGVIECTFINMFYLASAFNQDISGWNVSKATNMLNMFALATAFNNGGSNSIQNWSVPLCTNFTSMFQSATSFNQPLTNLVNTSGVAACTMNGMFLSATSFNQNIGGWNVSKATLMDNMFRNATAFNNGGSNTIQNWSAPLCTSFSSMFYLASAFNQPLTNLVNTSGVAGCTMIQMFRQASLFNQNIGGWDVSKVTTMTNMFLSAPSFNNGGSNTIQNWSAPLCISFAGTFQSASAFNQPLTNLVNTSSVAGCSLSGMFQSASIFNQDIGGWNVSKATTMLNMFLSAIAFNNGGSNTIQNWSAPLCTTFKAMFQSSNAFNQPLTNLVNTSGVVSCDMSDMFRGAFIFNQNIGGWNTSNVTNMSYMFAGTTSLSTTTRFNNGETGLTSIPNITPSTSSYANATKTLLCPGATFLTSLSIGDVLIIQTSTIVYSSSIQSITDNTNLVLTTAYGSDITVGMINSINKQVAGTSPLNWNTSNVTTIANMFQYCVFFNQNITKSGSNWNTNLVTTVVSLFQGSSTALITLFNNGEIITGTTAPMGWTFNVAPTSTNYRTNCRLTASNKPASLV